MLSGEKVLSFTVSFVPWGSAVYDVMYLFVGAFIVHCNDRFHTLQNVVCKVTFNLMVFADFTYWRYDFLTKIICHLVFILATRLERTARWRVNGGGDFTIQNDTFTLKASIRYRYGR